MIASLLLLIFQGPNGSVSTQSLLDMAPPGAVVRVSGHGEHLTIRKPVTLIGGGNFSPSSQDSITLDGPGSGSVTLVAITIEETLKGAGFDELHLERILVVQDANLDGFDYIQLADSAFFGTLNAPGSTVVSVLSHFSGQTNPQVRCHTLYAHGRFPLLVDVTERHEMPFDLAATYPARPGGSFDLVWHTPGPIGFLYMAEGGAQKPTPMPGANFGFNHLGSWTNVQLLAVERCSTSFDVPAATYTMQVPPGYDLIGREFAFQVYDPPAYYSSPAFVTIR